MSLEVELSNRSSLRFRLIPLAHFLRSLAPLDPQRCTHAPRYRRGCLRMLSPPRHRKPPAPTGRDGFLRPSPTSSPDSWTRATCGTPIGSSCDHPPAPRNSGRCCARSLARRRRRLVDSRAVHMRGSCAKPDRGGVSRVTESHCCCRSERNRNRGEAAAAETPTPKREFRAAFEKRVQCGTVVPPHHRDQGEGRRFVRHPTRHLGTDTSQRSMGRRRNQNGRPDERE